MSAPVDLTFRERLIVASALRSFIREVRRSFAPWPDEMPASVADELEMAELLIQRVEP